VSVQEHASRFQTRVELDLFEIAHRIQPPWHSKLIAQRVDGPGVWFLICPRTQPVPRLAALCMLPDILTAMHYVSVIAMNEIEWLDVSHLSKVCSKGLKLHRACSVVSANSVRTAFATCRLWPLLAYRVSSQLLFRDMMQVAVCHMSCNGQLDPHRVTPTLSGK
jgi:hypothetical protein